MLKALLVIPYRFGLCSLGTACLRFDWKTASAKIERFAIYDISRPKYLSEENIH